MQPEQAMALANEDSPVFLGAFGDVVAATFSTSPRLPRHPRPAEGVGWNRAQPCLFCGTARFFRTGYKHHLVQEWLPALDGVVDKLEAWRQGGRCRLRPRRVDRLMAKPFPIPTSSASTIMAARSSRRARTRRRPAVGPRHVSRCIGQDLSGQRLRPRLLLRLPARHGRSGRRGQTCRAKRWRGRHLHAGRTVRRRPAGGQPQSGRPHILRRLDHDLHAGIARPGGRTWARRTGRRSAAARSRARRAASRASAAPPKRRST